MKNHRLKVSAAALLGLAGLAQAQFNESWDVVVPLPTGWAQQNNSVPGTNPTWFQGNTTVFTPQATTGYVACNYNSTAGVNTISNWLITPVVPLANGAQFTFWARTVPTPAFPDRLQVRMNKVNSGTNVGTGATDVGDFTDLLLDINPTYTVAGFPNAWTLNTVTISGVTGTVNGRLAFRYFVENGGPSGSNSDYIGVDETGYANAGTPTGRCCLTNGTCQVVSAASCTGLGGTYAGNGTNCTPNVCPQPPTGACCSPLGTCTVVTQAACTTSGGTYAGNNVTCAAANCPQPPAGGTVSAINNRDATHPLLAFPVAAPAYTQVGTVVPTCFAMDYNGDGSVLYVITNAVGNNQLGTINPATGAFTAIATVSGAGAAEANWGGMSFDKSTNTMYAMGIAAGLNNLYTINLGTGVTTLVAPITGASATAIMIDFAINDAGTLMIGHDIGADQMLSINKATGVATVLGGTGLAANFAQGMDFDPTSGNLYAAIYTGGGTGKFCSVNTTTGVCTQIVDTTSWAAGVGAEMEMAIKGTAAAACYANCDQSTSVPLLTANDFQCFLNEYAAGHSYANCDQSTNPPVLTANDFQCFLNAYAVGCS